MASRTGHDRTGGIRSGPGAPAAFLVPIGNRAAEATAGAAGTSVSASPDTAGGGGTGGLTNVFLSSVAARVKATVRAGDADLASTLAWLKKTGTRQVRDGMARHGIPATNSLGVSVHKRSAFALLWGLSVHDRDAADDAFLECFPLIEAAAADERDYVKKGSVQRDLAKTRPRASRAGRTGSKITATRAR